MENLILEVNDYLAKITINRSKSLNALNRQTLEELKSAIEDLNMRKDVKIVIITGAGEKAFVAGADIKEMQKLNAVEGRELARLAQSVFASIENMNQVVIAVVNGYALGGGCELALACDIRLASANAKFGQPEVTLGVIPGFGGTQRLPRIVGSAKAKEMIFTGDMVDAQEAYRIGLVNNVYEQNELMEKATELAEKISSRGFVSVSLAKTAINDGLNMDIQSGCNYEANLFGLCFATEDKKEGMAAFVEKRKPNFRSC